ncbi:MAG: bifunctional UDP-sugar hydrolase/5'-nucleotidase [Chromatiaceae bacterium]
MSRSHRGRLLPWVLVFVLASAWAGAGASEPLPLTILHFNDFHGQLEPVRDPESGRSAGGIARLAGLVGAIRAERPERPVLLLFAGDLLQGTVTSTVFLGSPDVAFLSDMGLDAAAMGNHELDYGQQIFREMIAEARYPILAANLIAEPVPIEVRPFVMLEPAGGPRVAVLGLVTDELTTTTHPRNTGGIRVADPVETARRWVPELRRQADLVVVLSHLGYAADRRLAQEVPGVDLIVGGHNHYRFDEPRMEQGVPILQAGERGGYLGRIDLLVQDGRAEVQGYRLIPVDEAAPEDPRMAAEVQALAGRLETEIGVVVGRSAVDLDARRETIRRGESNFGDWVADLARELTGADLALFNAGTFRTSIRAGEVRIKDVYEAFPFGNELVTATLNGARLQSVLDRSAGLDPADNPGGFLQVSGVRFTIRDGRAESVEVAGRALDPAADYRVVMPDFLAAGGDGYAMLKDLPDAKETGTLILELVMDRFRNRPDISPSTDGRIVRR